MTPSDTVVLGDAAVKRAVGATAESARRSSVSTWTVATTLPERGPPTSSSTCRFAPELAGCALTPHALARRSPFRLIFSGAVSFFPVSRSAHPSIISAAGILGFAPFA